MSAPAQLKVLLVEDNPGDVRLIREMLRESRHTRFTVEAVDRLSDALVMLARGGYDAVLLDLGLPDSVGAATLRQALGAVRLAPIIVLTGLEDEEFGRRLVREGAHDYLVKGQFSSEFLERAIRYAIERFHLIRSVAAQAKNNAIGRIAGGVAHEFNNLLGAIITSNELLHDALKGGTAETQPLLKMIDDAADEGARIVKALVAFAAEQSLAPEKVDPDAAIRDIGAVLRGALRDGVTLLVKPAAGLPALAVDRAQLRDALLHLVLNASDAIEGRGTVTISAELRRIAEEGDLWLRPGRYVVITVADDGRGMDTETLARAFEPFFSTKPERHGVGLGLCAVLGFARQSGGNVRIESSPGKGTNARIFLPVAEQPAA